MPCMLTSETVNYLVWKYLQEEGLQFAAAALDKETQASRWEKEDAPVGELVKLLLKGQQLASIEETVDRKHRASDLKPAKKPKLEIMNVQPVFIDGLPEGGYVVDTADNGILVGGMESALYYNTESQTTSILDTDNERGTAVAFVNPKLGLVGDSSGVVRLWSLGESPALQAVLKGETLPDMVTQLKVSNSGRLVAYADTRHTVRVWDLETRKMLLEYVGNEAVMDLVWLNGDSSVGVSFHGDFTILTVDAESSNTEPESEKKLEVNGSYACELDSISRTLYVGVEDGIASIAPDHSISTWKAPPGTNTLALLGTYLFSGTTLGRVSLWDLSEGTPPPLVAAANFRSMIYTACADPKLERIAILFPGCVRILNAKTLEVIGQIERDGIQDMSWLGDTLVVVTNKKTELFNSL